MPFQEKSAWIMTLALLLTGGAYFALVATMSKAAGALVPPLLPVLILLTVAVTAIAVAGHVIAAVFAPKEANAPLDERERRIQDRAAHLSSYILGLAVLLALAAYLVTYSGDILFYAVFAGLFVSQVAEYILQITYYRRSI